MSIRTVTISAVYSKKEFGFTALNISWKQRKRILHIDEELNKRDSLVRGSLISILR